MPGGCVLSRSGVGAFLFDGGKWKLAGILRAGWISQVVAGTATPEYTMFVESSASPDGPFTADSSVALDTPNARFVVPITDTLRYYRVGDGRFNITGVKVAGDELYLSLEP